MMQTSLLQCPVQRPVAHYTRTEAAPAVKWVGGKRALLHVLLPRVPAAFDGYHEPFAGGAALFWRLRFQGRITCSVLADTNPNLVNLYRVIRDDVERLIAALVELRYDKDLYYAIRTQFNTGEGTPVERAAWFTLINRTGYNGLWRVNRSGGCNVPFGKYTNPTICDAENLRACADALRGVEVLHRDFELSFNAAKPGDFVYGDCPYVPLTASSNFTGYCADGFDMADQMRLRDAAESARHRGVHVLLSNSSAPAVFELYQGWTIETVDAKRAVNCKADGRGPVKEVLIW